jgi:hypothetical protein
MTYSTNLTYSMFATPTLLGGATFTAGGGGANGTPALLGASADGTTLYNSAANWTPGNNMTFTGILTARL